MWWSLLFPLVAAEGILRSLDHINSVYMSTVSGSSHELYTLALAAYDETMPVNGILHQIVLLLKNELDESLSIHAIRCWEDFQGMDYQLLNHSMPEVNPQSPGGNEEVLLSDAVSTLFNSTGTYSNINKQSLNITTFEVFNTPQIYQFELISADVSVQGSAYRVSVFAEDFNGTSYSYYSSAIEQLTVTSVGLSNKASVLTVLFAMGLSAVATYLGVYSYWKKHLSFPLAKGNDVPQLTFT